MANSVIAYVRLVAIFIASLLIIGIYGYDAETYDFIVKATKKNISCFQCDNYSFNVTGDRHKFAVMNEFCVKEPGRVRHFKKRCASDKAIGCGYTKTKYEQYSRNPAQRVRFQVRRFCVEKLLPKCEVSEGSRGDIVVCTCDSDFCNSAQGFQVPLSGMFLSIFVLLMQFRY